MVVHFYISLLLLHWSIVPSFQASNADSPDMQEIETLNEQALEVLLEDPVTSVKFAQKALEQAMAATSHHHIAYSYNILGLANDGLGNYATALDYYFLSLKHTKKIEDKQAMGIAMNNIAQFFWKQGNSELSLRYLKEALPLAVETGDTLTIGYVYNNLGLISDDNGDIEAAFTHYENALEIFSRLKESEGKALALHNLAWLYYAQENWDSASAYVSKALEVDVQSNNLEGIASDHCLLGMVYFKKNQYEDALEQFYTGLQVADKAKFAPIAAKLHEEIAQTYFHKKQYPKALENLEKYNELNDSIYNESNLTQISNFQTLYEVQLRQEELEQLQIQKELDDISLSFQRTFTYLLVACTIILLGLLLLLFMQNKQNGETIKALDKHNKRIREQNEALAFSNEELSVSQAKLKEFNETKDKFFSIISHDLKSPLNSLQGFMQLLTLQSDSLTTQELVHLAKGLSHSIDNLSALLDNLLGWSMSQMGKIEQRPTKVNLCSVVEENISLLEINAQAKNIQVQSFVEDDIHIYADFDMTSFVIRNLLSNAIKFTKNDGRITISSMAFDKYIHLCVIDNGIGIAPNDLEKLFKIGEHFSTQGTAKEKGTGLGLILCKEFAEKNNGKLLIESVLQKGTKITVVLPNYEVSPTLS